MIPLSCIFRHYFRVRPSYSYKVVYIMASDPRENPEVNFENNSDGMSEKNHSTRKRPHSQDDSAGMAFRQSPKPMVVAYCPLNQSDQMDMITKGRNSDQNSRTENGKMQNAQSQPHHHFVMSRVANDFSTAYCSNLKDNFRQPYQRYSGAQTSVACSHETVRRWPFVPFNRMMTQPRFSGAPRTPVCHQSQVEVPSRAPVGQYSPFNTAPLARSIEQIAYEPSNYQCHRGVSHHSGSERKPLHPHHSPTDITENKMKIGTSSSLPVQQSTNTSLSKVTGCSSSNKTPPYEQTSNNKGYASQSSSANQCTPPNPDLEKNVQNQHTDKQRAEKLLLRKWNFTSFGCTFNTSRKGPNEMDFTMASYNILAQNLLEDNMSLYDGSSEFLTWEYRSSNLLKEISQRQPDILCMQEVTENAFREFFMVELQKLDYRGEYIKRTGNKHDGCATFFKTSKFTLDTCIQVPYYRPGYSLMDRDNVGLIVLLRPVNKPQYALCVSNTHLLFNPKRGDIKLIQLQLLFAEVDKLLHLKHSGTPIPVIFCGDLNSRPYSHLYNFIISGKLDYAGLPGSYISGQEMHLQSRPLPGSLMPYDIGISDHCQYMHLYMERINYQINELSAGHVSKASTAVSTMYVVQDGPIPTIAHHRAAPKTIYRGIQGHGTLYQNFNFVSVYDHEYNRKGQWHREVTTSHRRANVTVDYIFYSVKEKECKPDRHDRLKVQNVFQGPLKLVGTLELPLDNYFAEYGRLPNDLISSDHVMLMAKFQWKFNG